MLITLPELDSRYTSPPIGISSSELIPLVYSKSNPKHYNLHVKMEANDNPKPSQKVILGFSVKHSAIWPQQHFQSREEANVRAFWADQCHSPQLISDCWFLSNLRSINANHIGSLYMNI